MAYYAFSRKLTLGDSVLADTNERYSSICTGKARLQIYTLGHFYVCKDNVVITSQFKRFNKMWELFLYLITHQNRPNPIEKIYDALWEEEDCMDARKKVNNLVHRLRKYIDVEEVLKDNSAVVYSQGCYSWNKDISYWLDVEVFEELCTEAKGISRKEPLRAVEVYKAALKYYRNGYLPELADLNWLIRPRAYYHQLFLRSLFDLLETLKKEEDYSEIIGICEKTFLIETFDEELHLRYLEALVASGKYSQAKSHYQYITALLYHEFGTKPSVAFQQIYQLIKKSETSVELNFNDFKDALNHVNDVQGALLCDTDTFTFLCRMEMSKLDRGKNSLFVLIFTITGPDYRLPPATELNESISALDSVINYSLRKGDIYSKWNESQFAILLKAKDPGWAYTITERIESKTNKAINCDKVVIKSSVFPLQPS